MVVTKSIEKILIDLTGEPRADIALLIGLRDIVAHRLEQVNASIALFKEKYKMPFSKFKKWWKESKISKKYSYKIEKDYWEWEGLVSRKAKLEKISKWIG